MAQGLKKLAGSRGVKKANSAKVRKQIVSDQKVRPGAPTKAPKKRSLEIIDDIALTRAIDRSNEQKVAAKLIQDGGRVKLLDIMQRGKEMNREKRRSEVKKKETRVEFKLKQLKEKAESEGLI